MAPRDLTSILDFMYQGEVNVRQEHLNTFLAVAEKLRVRGLCQNDSGSNSSSSNSKPFSSHSEKPKARPSDTSFSEPSNKRPRPGAQVQESPDDDDIEEVPAPVVKQEAGVDPVTTSTPGSSARLARDRHTDTDFQVADPGAGAFDESGLAEYGEEYGYEDEMGYGAEGAVMDPGQAKGKMIPNHKLFANICSNENNVENWWIFIKFVSCEISVLQTVGVSIWIILAGFPCDMCGRVYGSKSSLYVHRHRKHRKQAEQNQYESHFLDFKME